MKVTFYHENQFTDRKIIFFMKKVSRFPHFGDRNEVKVSNAALIGMNFQN